MGQPPVPDSTASPLKPASKFLYLKLVCSRFVGAVECEDVLVGIFRNEKIISPLRTGFCLSVFVESIREPLWLKGLSNLDADVPRYLMTITPDVCGLLGAMTLPCVLGLKCLMLAVTVCPRGLHKTNQRYINRVSFGTFLFSARNNWYVWHSFYIAF